MASSSRASAGQGARVKHAQRHRQSDEKGWRADFTGGYRDRQSPGSGLAGVWITVVGAAGEPSEPKAAKVRKGGKGVRGGAGVALGSARHSCKAPAVCPATIPRAAAIQDYEVTPLTFKDFRFDAKLPQAIRTTSADAVRCGLISVPKQRQDASALAANTTPFH